jgi:hypothetical protein
MLVSARRGEDNKLAAKARKLKQRGAGGGFFGLIDAPKNSCYWQYKFYIRRLLRKPQYHTAG